MSEFEIRIPARKKQPATDKDNPVVKVSTAAYNALVEIYNESTRLLGGPGHLGPHSGKICVLPPAADGPVPPDGGHPHHRGGLGPGGRADGPVRRPAQGGDGPAGRGPAAGRGGGGVHHRYHPEGRCGGLHLRQPGGCAQPHGRVHHAGLSQPPAAVRRGAAPAAAAPLPGRGRPGRRREADGGAAAEKRRTGQSP